MLYALTRFEFANITGSPSYLLDEKPVLMGVFSSEDKAYEYIEKEPYSFERLTSNDSFMEEYFGIPYLYLRDGTGASGKHHSRGAMFYITFLDYIADGTKKVYYMYKDDLTYPMIFASKEELDQQIRYYKDKANIKYEKYTSSKNKNRVVLYAKNNQDYLVYEPIMVDQYFVGGL